MEENKIIDNEEKCEKEPESKETEDKDTITEEKSVKKNSLNKKALVGIIVGIVVLLTIVAVVIAACLVGNNRDSADIGNDFYTEGLEFTRDWKGDYTVSVGSCKNAAEIVIPENYNGGKVIAIGEDAFSDCTSLTSITIPGSVKTISSGAFSGCTGLRNVIIPDSVTHIQVGAFRGCTSLVNVEFPDSVMIIDNKAFSDYDFLPLETFYENSLYRGNDENPYLVLVDAGKSDTTSVRIHASTKIIAPNAFSNIHFENIYFDGTVYEWFYGLSGKEFSNEEFTLFTSDVSYGIKYGDLFSALIASVIQIFVGVINGDETSVFSVAVAASVAVFAIAIMIPLMKVKDRKKYRG